MSNIVLFIYIGYMKDKEKALMLMGLHSRKWLATKMGISPITLDKRLVSNEWKISETSRLNELFEAEKINL